MLLTKNGCTNMAALLDPADAMNVTAAMDLGLALDNLKNLDPAQVRMSASSCSCSFLLCSVVAICVSCYVAA